MEKISSIPTEISIAAQEAQLGKFARKFVLDVQSVQASFQRSVFILCACGIGCCASIIFLLINKANWPTYISFLPVIWLIPILALSNGLKGFRIWRTGGEYAVYLYKHGFITALRWQEQWHLDVVSWKQVIAVWPTWGKGCLVTYEKALGQEGLIHFRKGLKECDLLIKGIQAQVTYVKIPKYIKDFVQGKNCSFAWLRGWDENRAIVEQGFLVTQQGLEYKSQFLPWNNIASIKIEGKQVVIIRQTGSVSPWVSTSAQLIANVEILVELVSYIVKQQNES